MKEGSSRKHAENILGVVILIVWGTAMTSSGQASGIARQVVPGRPTLTSISPPSSGGGGGVLGAASFKPSALNPVGWRGDGSGCYPGATPPTAWYRKLKNQPLMACQSAKPSGDAPPKAAKDMDLPLNDWLGIGPWDADDKSTALSKDHLSGETKIQPKDGDKVGNLTWKKAPMQEHAINLASAFGGGQKKPRLAYLHTYVYSDSDGPVALYWTHGEGCKLFLNGQLAVEKLGDCYLGKPSCNRLVLKKGWNSLLLKSYGLDQAWAFSAWMQKVPPRPFDFETKNLQWLATMPGGGYSLPTIAGDRLFVMGDNLLLCFDKKSGQCAWVRSVHRCMGLDAKTAGDSAAQIEQCVKKLLALENEIPRLVNSKANLQANAAQRENINKELNDICSKVDGGNYGKIKAAWQQGESAWNTTPCSDGENVYIWYQSSVAVCFDMAGNRKWANVTDFPGDTHHGFATSPILIDGKFIVKQSKLTAFNATTGKMEWSVPASFAHGSLVKAVVGKTGVLVEPDGVFHNVSDGQLYMGDKGGKDPRCNTIPSPVPVAGGKVAYVINDLFVRDLNALGSQNSLVAFPLAETAMCGGHYADQFISSPLYHNGYVYLLTQGGTLIVADVNAKKLAYFRQLDLRACWYGRAGITASLCAAGKYIYAMDDCGNTVVLEPGPVFKKVARNEFRGEPTAQWDGKANWDAFAGINSTPVFDDNRMYVRAHRMLYCIGEK